MLYPDFPISFRSEVCKSIGIDVESKNRIHFDGLNAAHYGTEGVAARYFTLHQTADVAHASVWRELIDKELAASPEAEEAALVAGERAAKALWVALDGVERQRLAVR